MPCFHERHPVPVVGERPIAVDAMDGCRLVSLGWEGSRAVKILGLIDQQEAP
jgi:hypothetical protein